MNPLKNDPPTSTGDIVSAIVVCCVLIKSLVEFNTWCDALIESLGDQISMGHIIRSLVVGATFVVLDASTGAIVSTIVVCCVLIKSLVEFIAWCDALIKSLVDIQKPTIALPKDDDRSAVAARYVNEEHERWEGDRLAALRPVEDGADAAGVANEHRPVGAPLGPVRHILRLRGRHTPDIASANREWQEEAFNAQYHHIMLDVSLCKKTTFVVR